MQGVRARRLVRPVANRSCSPGTSPSGGEPCICACLHAHRVSTSSAPTAARPLVCSAGEIMALSEHSVFDLVCFIAAVHDAQHCIEVTVLPVHSPRMPIQLRWDATRAQSSAVLASLLAQQCSPRPCNAKCSHSGSGVLSGSHPTLLRGVSSKFNLQLGCQAVAANAATKIHTLQTSCSCAGHPAASATGSTAHGSTAGAASRGWQTMEILFTPSKQATPTSRRSPLPTTEAGSQFLTQQCSMSLLLDGAIEEVRCFGQKMLPDMPPKWLFCEACIHCDGVSPPVTSFPAHHNVETAASLQGTPWLEALESDTFSASQLPCKCRAPCTTTRYTPLSVLVRQRCGKAVWWALGSQEVKRLLAGVSPRVAQACLEPASPHSQPTAEKTIVKALRSMLSLLLGGTLHVQAYVHTESVRSHQHSR